MKNKSTATMRSENTHAPDVANYDLNPNYHYSSYWVGREYEHKAEIIAISSLFNSLQKHKYLNSASMRILDLGGAFGRLTPSYCHIFDDIILGDYSLKELGDALVYLSRFGCGFGREKNLTLIGLNAYFLPFKKGVFDSVISVRLLHHIEDPEVFLKEIYRVLKDNGILVLEIANKDHMKAILRNIIRGNFKFFRKNRIKVSHNRQTAQGITGKEKGYVFYNYKVSYIIKLARKLGFSVIAKKQVSILRAPLLKKILNIKLMLFVESLFQRASNVLNWFNIYLSPSVFIVLEKQSQHRHVTTEPKCLHNENSSKASTAKMSNLKALERILECPKHRNALFLESIGHKKYFLCKKGGRFVVNKNNVIDLRFPIITV